MLPSSFPCIRSPEQLPDPTAMNDRIHRHLDGDLPPDALGAGELARAAELRRTAERAAAALRAAPVPDLSARVMAALPPRRAPWWQAVEWLWRPRALRLSFRPAFALAGGALAVALAAVVPLPGGSGAEAPPAAVAAAAEPVVYVHFRLEAADAREVAVAGTFTGWRPDVPMERTGEGVWTVLVPLQPGVHDYVFVVDGAEWIPDPDAPHRVDDSFGGTNSRISLLPPSSAT